MAKKMTAHQKAARHYLNLIKKAQKNLAKSQAIQNRLSATNKLITGVNFNKSKEFLKKAEEYVQSGKRFTKRIRRMMAAVQERTHADYYTDLMRFRETISKDIGPVSIPIEYDTKVSEISKLKRKYNKKPESVSQEDFDRLSNFSQILNPVYQAYAKTNTDQLKQAILKNKKVSRDTGFGGNSQLINDLWYSARANPYGREMVERVMSLMQNPTYFNAIETMYLTTEEGKDIKRQLDQAVGKDWYEEFKTAMQAIIQLITMIKTNVNLSTEEQNALGELLERYEGESESYEKG